MPVKNSRPGVGDKTILAVDDDEFVREIAVLILEDLGYVVLQACDGATALTMLEQYGTKIDLLFTDIMMPGGMTGIDLVAVAIERYPHLKVLFATGFADVSQHDSVMRFPLLNKPYKREVLVSALRDIFEQAE